MSTFELSGVDASLARRLQAIDEDWLEGQLETLAETYHEQRQGSEELAPFDKKSEIFEDSNLSAEKARQLGIKWDREIGRKRR